MRTKLIWNNFRNFKILSIPFLLLVTVVVLSSWGGVTPTLIVQTEIAGAQDPNYSSNQCLSPNEVRNQLGLNFISNSTFLNTPYNASGVGNDTYYFHFGSGSLTNCFDNGNSNINSITFSGPQSGFTVWLDLASQCHQCHSNNFTGTWWKTTRFFSAEETQSPNNLNLGILPIERLQTNCNSNTTYGCQAGEQN